MYLPVWDNESKKRELLMALELRNIVGNFGLNRKGFAGLNICFEESEVALADLNYDIF